MTGPVPPPEGHRDPAERARRGRAARARVPAGALADLGPGLVSGPGPDGRPDPVGVVVEQNRTRVPELLPYRHERMAASPFAFLRGSAAVMAADLGRTSDTGLWVQLCGDAHLSNFGLFASPERHLVFDLNDFDETCPGPWEWDLKRLLASIVVAGRGNGFDDAETHAAARLAVQRYAAAMARFAAMGNLELWHTRIDAAEARRLLGPRLDKKTRKRLDGVQAKALKRDHLRALRKLTEVRDGRRRIVADPPLVVPIDQLAADRDVDGSRVRDVVGEALAAYVATLEPGHRRLVESYSYVDAARKAVGVGSVGTRCWIVLMEGRDDDDPLLLQLKEAQESVLARHVAGRVPAQDVRSPGGGPAPWRGRGPGGHGRRVVEGQRLVQAASDPFLGWHTLVGLDGRFRDFYVRQLHDWKGGADVESQDPHRLGLYGELCAWTLARAHARSGDRIALSAYVGDPDAPDGAREVDELGEALVGFAHGYADVTAADHAAFCDAVRSGRLPGRLPDELLQDAR